MWNWIKKGWAIAWQQPFVVFALFIYNLAWGITLYKLVQSVVVPLLHRYPGNDLPAESVQLFWVESQFQIMKTNLMDSYLWWVLILLGIRMLLHPMLNAGVYYSLHHQEMNAGYRFVEGIRKLTLPYLGLYVLQMLVSLAPLYWLVPHVTHQFTSHSSYASFGKALLPIVTAYMVYLFVLHLLFLFLQFGKLTGKSPLQTMFFMLRNVITIMLTAFLVLLISLVVSTAVMASAFLWAGFLALLLYQAYRLTEMFFKLWAIGTQYAIWSEKA